MTDIHQLASQVVHNHLALSHGITVVVAVFFAKIDAVIKFSLRFFKPETINAELDNLDTAAKARVLKDAAQQTSTPQGPTAS
jgi:hypothetical protein